MLTPREYEILSLMFEGHSYPAIAQKLGMTNETVEKHHKRLLKKFNARNSVELVRKALEDSWLKI